ncbi:unnamed protein product [Toxocara canis]|uniref:Serine/threonine-protein phosphatase n=1 Tax=Toxocara canis TaxID=6265 RepID=A0A183UDM9_TOXCA|nr:unnamed protein product [Toxocara canis]
MVTRNRQAVGKPVGYRKIVVIVVLRATQTGARTGHDLRSAQKEMAEKIDIDEMICKLLNVGSPGCSLTKTVKEQDVMNLCTVSKEVLMSQNSLIEVDPPIRICGDIHGQYADLLRLFDRGGFPPFVNYIFLGDYVDRGKQSLECICLLLCYKVKYSENFFILRGNHECSVINRVYGFFEECSRRYQSVRLWQAFQEVFNTMPFTGLVAGKILCMHGGLSPQLKSIDQLRQITRPIDPPNPSLHIDLDGYEFFANRKLVTIFSAPHYCGQFDNAAAMMNVDEGLVCTFQVSLALIHRLQ